MFLDYKDLSSREAYEYYKNNRKYVSKTIDQYNYFKKAVEGLTKVIKECFLENEEGVCIRDLGYLGMVKTKEKVKTRNPLTTSLLKKHNKRYIYKPILFTDVMYENWHMEFAFSHNVYDSLLRNKKSKSYKLRKTLCDSIIVSEDFIKKAEEVNKKNPQRNKNYKKEARK